MIDPTLGMESFQQALRRGKIDLHVTKTDPNLFVHLDAPNGPPEIRYTYVRLKGKTVTAMVIFAAEPPIKGKTPFFSWVCRPKAIPEPRSGKRNRRGRDRRHESGASEEWLL